MHFRNTLNLSDIPLSSLSLSLSKSYDIDEALGYTIWQYEIITSEIVLISEGAHKIF